MDRPHSNYSNSCRCDSPVRVVSCPKNQTCCGYSDPFSFMQTLQNNPMFQDPQCLNNIIIPMLLVQLMQNQQACHCRPNGSHQLPFNHSHHQHSDLHQRPSPCDRLMPNHGSRSSRHHRRPSYVDHEAPVQEVFDVSPMDSFHEQSSPSIHYSDEEMRFGSRRDCHDKTMFSDPIRRRNLMPSVSNHYGQNLAQTMSPTPDKILAEKCFWCGQQLHKFFDPDLGKRVFSHYPSQSRTMLEPAGKSSYGCCVGPVSSVDLSPFNPDRDSMLPCPFMSIKADTTYNSSYRHPGVVAKESFLPKKNNQPFEQESNSNFPFGPNSNDSIGRVHQRGLNKERIEEGVSFIKPNYRADSRQMQRSSLALSPVYKKSGPSVTFSPSTDLFDGERYKEKEAQPLNGRDWDPSSSMADPDPHPRRFHRRRRRPSPCRSRSGSSYSQHSLDDSFSDSRRRSRGRTSRRRCNRKCNCIVRICPSHRKHRHRSAPHKSKSRKSSSSRSRAKSITIGCDGDSRSRRHHRKRRHHKIRTRRSRSDPASSKKIVYCNPEPPKSVYNASYGNPASIH